MVYDVGKDNILTHVTGVVELDTSAVEGWVPDADINAASQGLGVLQPDSVLNPSTTVGTTGSVGPELGIDPGSLLTLLHGGGLDASGDGCKEEGDEAGGELHCEVVDMERRVLVLI